MHGPLNVKFSSKITDYVKFAILVCAGFKAAWIA
jgi:hypothetical protein